MTTFRSHIEAQIPGSRFVFQGIDALDKTIRRTVHKDLGVQGAAIILGGISLAASGLKSRSIAVVAGLGLLAATVHDLAVTNGLVKPSRIPESNNGTLNKGVKLANNVFDSASEKFGSFLSDQPAVKNANYTILPEAITQWFRLS